MKRPTMSDVAARASVSKTTVSHVINNTRFVEEETKQRVLQAVAELGYRPSVVARSLTTNRTETIGVVISDASNYFFGEVLHGIEDVLRPANYGIIICNTAEIMEREAHYLDLLFRQRVDGVIALGCVIRGETAHFEHVSREAISGLNRTGLELGLPVAIGILTAENLEQARIRSGLDPDPSGGKGGGSRHRGREAAEACLEMVNLLRRIAER